MATALMSKHTGGLAGLRHQPAAPQAQRCAMPMRGLGGSRLNAASPIKVRGLLRACSVGVVAAATGSRRWLRWLVWGGVGNPKETKKRSSDAQQR